MIERDFLLRQIQQAIQVLAQVLLQKRDGTPEWRAALADGIRQVTGTDPARLAALSREETLDLATDDGEIEPEKAVALADLFQEAEERALRVRARWLYQAALKAGGPVPHDVLDRIAALPDEGADDEGTNGETDG
ncbi:MAG: hypothetical protein AAGI52_17770 [Bacteroidota bacterium]